MKTKISAVLFTTGMCITVVTAVTLLVVTGPVVWPTYYFARTLVLGMAMIALSVKLAGWRSR